MTAIAALQAQPCLSTFACACQDRRNRADTGQSRPNDTVVYVALPPMTRALNLSTTQVTWVRAGAGAVARGAA